MRRSVWVSTILGAVALLTAAAPAKEHDERIVELIHSSLPLYAFDWDDIWPRGFNSGDEFGCTSRIAFGDWLFTPADSEAGEEYWSRYANYGVFHCAAIIRSAHVRANLEKANFRYGFFVRIGKDRVGSEEWELWAIQQGVVPGSDYTLLARPSKLTGKVDSFQVLQQRCPRGRRLEAKGLDIWSARYCAIDSRADLLSLARRMLRLPQVGTLRWVEASPEAN